MRAGNGAAQMSALCLCGTLRQAARAVTQLYDLVLAPAGLKSTQFLALMIIDEAGEIAQYQFARKYAVAVETLSRRLGSLRRKGLVKVRTGEKHNEQIYSLTAAGRDALNRAHPFWELAQSRLQIAMGEANCGALLELCGQVPGTAALAQGLRICNQRGMTSAHQSRTAAA